jgi:hypothetical protein
MTDNVNNPSHYTSDPSGVEAITITRHRSFNIGNAIKYLWRAGLKDADCHTQDLEKAIWYIRDEIERLNEEAGKNRLRELMRKDSLPVTQGKTFNKGDIQTPCDSCKYEDEPVKHASCLRCVSDPELRHYPAWEPKP